MVVCKIVRNVTVADEIWTYTRCMCDLLMIINFYRKYCMTYETIFQIHFQ